MSRTTKLMKNTAIIAIGNICTKCISFLMLPLYTSLLTTTEYGVVDLLGVSVSLLVIILTLQYEQGVFRFLIDVRDEKGKQEEYISTTFVTVLIVNTIFVVVAYGVLILLGYEYTLYLLINVVLSVFNAIILQISRGLGDNATYTIGSCISGSTNVLLNVLFIAVFRWGINGMLFATVVSLFCSTIYTFMKLKIWRYLKFKIDKNCFQQLAKYSFPLVPYTLCWWIISASDRAIINFFLGTAANGIYSIAHKFPTLFSTMSNIFQLSWTESASENVKDENRDLYYQSIINKAIRFYSSCNMGIIALMPLVFQILIKKEFVTAYDYIPVVMVAALFHSIAALYGSLYFAFKETKKVSTTTALAAVINVVVNVSLIKFIGLYAASVSSVIAYLTIIIIRHIDVQKMVKIKIEKKYLFIETMVYFIMFISYYSPSQFFHVIALVLVLPYCFWQNREMLISLMRTVKSKIRVRK